MRYTWRGNNIYIKRSWDLHEESMGPTWREQNIYIKRLWDLVKDRIRSI